MRGIFGRKEHGARPKHDHREGLIGPGKITPDDAVVDERDAVTEQKQRNRDGEANFELFLVELKPVEQRHPRASKRRIARGDRADVCLSRLH